MNALRFVVVFSLSATLISTGESRGIPAKADDSNANSDEEIALHATSSMKKLNQKYAARINSSVDIADTDQNRQRFLNELYDEFLADLPFDISFLQLKEYQEKYSSFIADPESIEEKPAECEQYKLTTSVVEFRVCPVQWVARERQNRFPRTRMTAKCRCNRCLGGSTASFPLPSSRCMPVYVLMPALIRVQSVSEEFNWRFYLEPVPTTCVCGTTLDPVN